MKPNNFLSKNTVSISNSGAIHIAFVSDRNYLNFVFIAVTSLLDNFNPDNNLIIHLVHPGIEDSELAPLMSLRRICDFNLQLHKIDLESFEKRWGLRSPLMYRLELPELCPDVDRMIYCDCDLVFLDDIQKLFDFELGDAVIAGRGDRAGRKVEHVTGVPAGQYFNSGVLLMDLKAMREMDAVNGMAALWNSLEVKPRYCDQSLLNMYFKENSKFLPSEWNMINEVYRRLPVENMYTIDEIIYSISHPGIAHFTGSHKPWKFFKFTHHAYAPWFWHYALKAPIPMRLKIKYWLKRLFTGRYHDSRHEARPWNYKMVHLPGRKRHD